VHVFGPSDHPSLAPDRLYTPGPAGAEDLLAHQRALGLERVVIVQPTPYGADNSCTLEAAARLGPRARAVAVIGEGINEQDLRSMHRAGVRGVRVNLETTGVTDPALAQCRLEQAARIAAPLGWHVQSYTNLDVIAGSQQLLADLPAPVVFDHFARAPAAGGPDNPALRPLLQLLAAGKAYVKVSAPHRISERADYADVGAIARAFIKAGPSQVIWGSDWPHSGRPTGSARDPSVIKPFRPEDDGRALNLLADWAGDAQTLRAILVDNPARLYGFA
jgi:predicted TIM-barrel fold metal-dependent hydrolase